MQAAENVNTFFQKIRKNSGWEGLSGKGTAKTKKVRLRKKGGRNKKAAPGKGGGPALLRHIRNRGCRGRPHQMRRRV